MPRTNEPITTVIVGGEKRYRAVVDTGTVDGKRKQVRSTFKTMREAKAWVAETRTKAATGAYQHRTAKTFASAVEEWLLAKDGKVRPATLYDYRSGIKPYLDALGSLPLQRITKEHVEAVVHEQHEAGLSVRTVTYALGLCKQVLDRHVPRALPYNVALGVEVKGKAMAEAEALTIDELRAIAQAIKGHAFEHALTLTMYGLRRSEILGLRWEDLDLKAGTLSISRSRVEKTKIVGDPKTKRGRRCLPLDGELLAILAETKRAQSAFTGWIVVDELGEPLRPERYSDMWRAVLDGAKVRQIDLRGARRSSVTAMRDRGVPDHHVAAWHGHDEAVMRRHYSVAHDDGLKAASATISGLLRTKSRDVG